MLIGGTFYAGEIKKSIFTLMNDRLPLEGVFPMHCSANVGDGGDVAIFFGLSGTGKTTLSADPERKLIGDDEHGWGDDGVFNFEGGCYAKVIRLSAEAEPEIYRMTRTFGTILENVVMDERGVARSRRRLEDREHARRLQARADREPPAREARRASASVVLLTADAFGILPPIARLTRDQAMYWFLSGFTAKLAGTEIGVQEPQPTFSACFGAPFLPQPPAVYARLLAKKLDEHGAHGLAREHGLDRGPVRRGAADADQGDARAAPLPRSPASWTESSTGRTSVFGFEVPVDGSGRRLEAARSALAPGATPTRTTRRRASWRRMFRDNFTQVRRGRQSRRRRPAALGVVPEQVGSSGPPWRLRAGKQLSPKEDPDEASR